MKLASGENGSSNRRKLDAKSGRVKLLTMIRLETCVLHRWREKESERLRKKISRLLNNFEFTRQIYKDLKAKKRVDLFICPPCFLFSTLIKIP